MATANESPRTIEAALQNLPTGLDEIDQEEKTYLLLRLSPEVDHAIESLMERTHLPKADVLNMAVGLLKAAADAIAEGKRVGIAAADQDLEVEFTGL
jgi:hypothetical protein